MNGVLREGSRENRGPPRKRSTRQKFFSCMFSSYSASSKISKLKFLNKSGHRDVKLRLPLLLRVSVRENLMNSNIDDGDTFLILLIFLWTSSRFFFYFNQNEFEEKLRLL